MRTSSLYIVSLSSIALAAPAPNAGPSPVPTDPARIAERQTGLVGGLLGLGGDVLGVALSDLNNVFSDVAAGNLVGSAAWSSISSALEPVTATATQTDAAAALRTLSAIHAAQPTANPYEFLASLVAQGLTTDSIADGLGFFGGVLGGENSMNNVNPDPSPAVYPSKACGDAPYSVSEADLRGAIRIPSTFTYGQKPPVILFPGTGNTGYITFQGNFIQLLTGVQYADPVWVNVPGYLLDDAQKNAEYAAYAINYISSISKGVNVSVIAWSQGNIDTQWAFKYWPSTRKVTSNHIAISPDYAGTVNANLICPDGLPCDPSVLQQQYLASSNFITTLRGSNGDSAYVPTTVLYSALFDEIVQPQAGEGASAFLLDARGVGVTNNEVQTVCSGLPGGSFYTHEGMLYNPLAFALAKDALINGGPGLPSRVEGGLSAVCNQYLATGLNVGNLLITENAVLIALLALVLYEPKVTVEPSIKSYALASTNTCPATSTTTSSRSTTLSTSSTTPLSFTTSSIRASTTSSTRVSTTSSSRASTTSSTRVSTTSSSRASTTSSTRTSTTSSFRTSTTTTRTSSTSTRTSSTSTRTSSTPALTPRVATTTTSSTAAATPTATPARCPADNGKVIESGGKRFLIQCSTDYSGGNLKMVYTNDRIPGCAAACASTSGCVGATLSGTACYMKSSLAGNKISSGTSNIKLLT